jgi:hypothetical protein
MAPTKPVEKQAVTPLVFRGSRVEKSKKANKAIAKNLKAP